MTCTVGGSNFFQYAESFQYHIIYIIELTFQQPHCSDSTLKSFIKHIHYKLFKAGRTFDYKIVYVLVQKIFKNFSDYKTQLPCTQIPHPERSITQMYKHGSVQILTR